MSVYDTPGAIAVTVDLPIGELSVSASNRADTKVNVRSDPRDKDHADAVKIDLVGNELRIQGPKIGILQKLTSKSPGSSIEVQIELPAGSSLTVQSGYGAVQTTGRLGACFVRTQHGDVRIEDATTADLVIHTGQARVTGTIEGNAELSSDHGGVHVGRIGGSAKLRSKYGNIRVDEIVGHADLDGGYESINIDALHAGAQVKTLTGSVSLGCVERGEVSLTSTHGRLEVGIPDTSAVWLDVDTGGRVSNDLTPREEPADLAETVSVVARSQTGNVVIRRA